VRAKKKKIDLPIFSRIENIFKEYNISTAAYHGGKLNGEDCQNLFLIIFMLNCFLLYMKTGAVMTKSVMPANCVMIFA
jgi:hypothetical protein